MCIRDRPDCISDSILERLKKYDASIIELGVQSMDAKVLIDSVRGHDIESVIKSAKLIKEHDIKLGLQMMVGLPSCLLYTSPAMYNYSFEILDLDYKYLAFDIPVEKTEDAVNAFRTFNMKGGNVTMPCKGEVAKYMDELSPASRIIGACNTIINKDGKLIGDITDGKGYVRNLKENGVDIKGRCV